MKHWISEDPQVLFNHVVTKLAEQGRWSAELTVQGPECRYLTADGRRCAAGHCMTDEGVAIAHQVEAERSSGGVDLATLLRRHLEKPPPGTIDLLYAMQLAHDQATTRADLRRRLTNVAKRFELTPDVLDQQMPTSWCLLDGRAFDWRV